MKKIILPVFIFFSILFLVYLLFPGPKSIDDFTALPNSQQSNLSGDTWQVPNLKAYYSNNYRDFSVNYYKDIYESLSGLPFSAMRLNYPPEFAYTAIKDQTKSTYLEEITYPMRDSLFVNGLEPFNEDGSARYPGATKMGNEAEIFETKVTIRYVPSKLTTRIIVWFLINVSLVLLYLETMFITNKND